MSFKKFFAAGLAFLFLALVGCGDKTVSAKEITDTVISCVYDSEDTSLVPLERNKIEGYFGFSEELLDDFSVTVSSLEETVFEVGALSPDDTTDRDTVIDGINRRLTDTAGTFKLINNASYESSVGFLLMQLDDTVIYVISKDIDKIEKALTDIGATEIN